MKNLKGTTRYISLMLAALLLMVSGCGGAKSTTDPAGQTSAPKEVVVGIVQPLTGSLAYAGEPSMLGAKHAVEEKNKTGGIKSMGGAQIKIITGDAQSKPDVGATEAERVIRDGAVALIGSFSSSITAATTQVAEKNKIPMVIDEGMSDNILERGFKYTFRTAPSASISARGTVDYVLQVASELKLNNPRTVVLNENTLFGSTMVEYIKEYAPKAGLNLVGTIAYDPSSPDLTTEVSKAQQLKPDILMVSGYYADSVLVVRAMSQLRFKPALVVGNISGAFSNPNFVKDLGPLSEGIMDNNFRWNPKSEGYRSLQAYLTSLNKPMTHDAADGYLAAKVLIDAIERAGSADPKKIRDALAATNLKVDITPYAEPITFDAQGQNAAAKTVLTQIHDGQVKIVYPKEYAEAEPVTGQ